MLRVAIVGRPNVGKSTLFNKLTGTRKALVGHQPGVTRDRLSGIVNWAGKEFELFDTGGITPGEKETLADLIFRQVEIAVAAADLILLIVDGREGLTSLDQEIGSFLRKSARDFLLVVNKIDVPELEALAGVFYQLGPSRLFPISAEHSTGLDNLLEVLIKDAPDAKDRSQEEIRVAVIGRPNVGKSSLVNYLTQQDRMIVMGSPGTTRDAVDTLVTHRGRSYRLIDTAGIRRKGRKGPWVEKLSVVMARKSIERCDVVLLMIDVTEGARRIDAVIGGYAHDAGKSLVIVVNKWDLVDRDSFTALQFEKEFRGRMRYLDYAPLVFVSAKTGLRVFKLLDVVEEAYRARFQRVSTAELNSFVNRVLVPRLQLPESSRFPVMYLSQVGVSPPTFVFFTRTRRQIHFSLKRFLINQLRRRYGFQATPLRVIQRLRTRKTS